MSLPQLECIYVTEGFVRECKSGNSSFKLESSVPMPRFLFELCFTMVRGDLPVQYCKAALESVGFGDKSLNEQLGSCFADVVTQLAQDPTMPGDQRGRLIKLAKWAVESQLVPQRLFQERCEEEFLWEAEMVKIKAQDLKGKEVRVNTRLLYQQTKFNLLREESEGYAKLATLLCQALSGSSRSASTATVGIIKSLIGHFDLDPNRVFDIVLDCFELQPDNSMFLDFIPMFPKSHASQILGFKFQYYQRLEVNNPVPSGLFKLTALLIKEKFMDLDSIYIHLLPKDEKAFEHYNAFSAKRLEEANKIGKINLAAIGKDLMEDEKQGDVTIDLFAALDMETESVAERSPELENNQTLGLLIGFLSVEDWYHAQILFQRLAPLNPVAHTQICRGLFRLIEKSISSAYKVVCQTRFQNSISIAPQNADSVGAASYITGGRFVDLPKEFFEMLVTTGPYIYRDTLLLQKICRVLRGCYLCALDLLHRSDASSSHAGGDINPRLHLKEVRTGVEEALGSCLLPSLQLVPANPAVGHEIWEVMSLLPFEVRYRLYGEWEKDDERNPLLVAARQVAKLDTRRILKRLAKENLKQLGRMVAKLAHASPMTVLRTIVHQIEAYRDMITPVVDAFKYLTQLEYDILEYVVIERLVQGGRDKLKDDGLNLSDWLQSLASFWGHLCKKYPSMELRGLFQYLVNQLKRGQGIELVVLQELIQQMANVQYTENLTEEQLDAMAGSETLRYQATSFGVTRNNKALIKSINRLRDALLPNDEPKLAMPLLLLIAQYRSVVLIKSDAPYIKMVSEQFDRCHGMLLQYVEFLCSAMTPAFYAQLIPSLDDLVHMYHLDPEVAFLLYRPVMRLFRCRKNINGSWPLDIDEASNMETDNLDSESLQSSLTIDLGPARNSPTWCDLLNTVKTMLPSKAWNSLSPDLYATFWGLTLYDLYVPRNRYESEISKLHAALKTLEEVSDNSSSAIAKRKKEKERIQESLDRLTGELRKHEEHVASVHRRLSREKDKWLSSCPDTLKINMEFLQRCIFPRCTFSMADAVYCAMFVHTLHSLGTPYFNTVNHIDVLICKTLQPMICCCTEYEAGRLGRFLYETLKIAYYWKSDESVYERECGNMPGFAVYYRYPNSQRVTYGQFIKVHWKWSQRITRLLIQCLESNEYMEIRNALIMLTKISSVFPVTRKTGINLEKRVAKIRSDEREDLKVLATGVAAALAARKPSWVTDEEFGMGFLELKAAPSNVSKHGTQQNGSLVYASQSESAGTQLLGTVPQHSEIGSSSKDQILRTKLADGRSEKMDGASLSKSDHGHLKSKGGTASDFQSVVAGKVTENQKQKDETASRLLDESTAKVASKSSETEIKASSKRTAPTLPVNKAAKQDLGKDDIKSGKAVGRTSGSLTTDKDLFSHSSESRQGGSTKVSATGASNGGIATAPAKVKDDGAEASDAPKPSLRHDTTTSAKSSDRMQRRPNSSEDTERLGKRRKGDADHRDHESDPRLPERERSADPRVVGFDRTGSDDQIAYRERDRSLDRLKEKNTEGYDRDYRERLDVERVRDKSTERYGRERSVERGADRSTSRGFDRTKDERNKDERSKQRYGDTSVEKSLSDDQFHSQGLPPPPPLPPNLVPQSLSGGRREEDVDRRSGTSRHSQRLSPRHDERERRRSEENLSVSQDDVKRRRDDDLRDRKRDEREAMIMKVEEREREREREKALLKEDMEAVAASKRRKLKREHISLVEPGEYSPVAHQSSSSLSMGMPPAYDLRDGRDRKGSMMQHGGYLEEPSLRLHPKEVSSRMARRDTDPLYDREWEEEKRLRAEQKRRHSRK